MWVGAGAGAFFALTGALTGRSVANTVLQAGMFGSIVAFSWGSFGEIWDLNQRLQGLSRRERTECRDVAFAGESVPGDLRLRSGSVAWARYVLEPRPFEKVAPFVLGAWALIGLGLAVAHAIAGDASRVFTALGFAGLPAAVAWTIVWRRRRRENARRYLARAGEPEREL